MARHRGHGTLLKMSDMAGTPVFTTIAQVRDIRGPSVTRGVEGNPDHDMSGGIDKVADALYDGGQVTFDIAWDPDGATHSGAAGLRPAHLAGTIRDFRIDWPNSGSATTTFSAYVTEMTPSAPANRGWLTCSVVLDVSGDVVEAT